MDKKDIEKEAAELKYNSFCGHGLKNTDELKYKDEVARSKQVTYVFMIIPARDLSSLRTTLIRRLPIDNNLPSVTSVPPSLLLPLPPPASAPSLDVTKIRKLFLSGLHCLKVQVNGRH